MYITIISILQTAPSWFIEWSKKSQKAETIEKTEDLERKLKYITKEYERMKTKYRFAAQQGSVSLVSRETAISRAIEDKVSSYAYAQGRASLESTRKTVAVPHPDIGDLEVPYIDGPFTNIMKVPVQGKDLILEATKDGEAIILKRRSSLFHAVQEYHGLSQLKGTEGIPEVIGIHHSYCESFVLTKCIASECRHVTLQDAIYWDAFQRVSTKQWRELLYNLYLVVDNIHSLGYIHNNLVASNIVLKVQEESVLPHLVGFSLLCHTKDAVKLFRKHDKEFAAAIKHFHPDVFFLVGCK